ncbi:MAG TPA: hypothetical protein ENH28_03475 [Euryarchaeota archaeon]|nr:NADH dehydrogenase [archaeon BMS3Bbin15]HDL15203.1 hypothetical protein [Euryarchaeota archaeon]
MWEILETLENKIVIRLVPGGKEELFERLRKLGEKLSHISDKIEFTIGDEKLEIKPAMVLIGRNKRIIYSFYPEGKERGPFLKNLIRVSSESLEVSEKFAERIKAIDKDINIKIFATEFCPVCPGVIDRTGRLVSEHISLHVIDILSFMEFEERYEITATPTLIINDEAKLEGKLSLKEILEWIEKVARGDKKELIANMLEKGMLENVIEIAEREGLEETLAELVFDSSMRVRIGAVAALEDLHLIDLEKVKKAIPVLLEKLKTDKENIRGDVIYALEKIADSDVIEELEEELENSEGNIKDALEDALSSIKKRNNDDPRKD